MQVNCLYFTILCFKIGRAAGQAQTCFKFAMNQTEQIEMKIQIILRNNSCSLFSKGRNSCTTYCLTAEMLWIKEKESLIITASDLIDTCEQTHPEIHVFNWNMLPIKLSFSDLIQEYPSFSCFLSLKCYAKDNFQLWFFSISSCSIIIIVLLDSVLLLLRNAQNLLGLGH